MLLSSSLQRIYSQSRPSGRMEVDGIRSFSLGLDGLLRISEGIGLNYICNGTQLGLVFQSGKFNFENQTGDVDDLIQDDQSQLYLFMTVAIYIMAVFFMLSVAVPISLVVYVYLYWPTVIIYDFVFGCLNRLGYFKDVDRWEVFMNVVCRKWKYISRVWHGYETRGMENIPDNSPAIFVFYHGKISLDIYYFVKAVNLEKRKLCRAVFHKQLIKLPGWHLMEQVARGLCGTRENCLKALRDGDYIVIAPGGDVEPLFSDESNYELMWKNRTGFAKIAIEAGVPIIPVFTENIQELFRTPRCLRSFFVYIDSILHVPLVPAYGGFPVKLRTHIGSPIYPNNNVTPVQLAQQAHDALQKLILKNQRIPGNIMAAIAQRF